MKNKNVLISGGLGFLGSHFCKILSKNNFNVILIDKRSPKTPSDKSIVSQSLKFHKVDITNESQIKKMYMNLKKNKIFIDVLINNAAIDSIPKSKQKNSHLPNISDWNKELSVSLTGSYLLIKYFGQDMAKNKKGKIINIGSDLSVIAPNQNLYSDYKNFFKPVTYSVVKHGLLGITKYFASLYSKDNVQVNMISPGPVYNQQKKRFVRKLKKFIPMNRLSKLSDLEEPLLFLVNERNSYFTGQNLIVDGGRTII